MSSTLGFFASGRLGHLSSPIVGAMDALATVTLSSAQSSVAFVGIPQNYSYLELRWVAQDNRNTVGDNISVALNGDSTQSNYRSHRLLGYSGGVLAQDYGNSNGMGEISGGDTANVFGGSILTLVDYASPFKNKSFKTIGGIDNNTNGELAMYSSFWMNTNPVTSMTLTPTNASTFSTNSTFSLYGVR